IVISIGIGAIGAWLQGSRHRLVRFSVAAYVQFFRNTPSLIQLYFFYFAVDAVVAQVLGGRHLFGSFGWAVFALSLFAVAFNVVWVVYFLIVGGLVLAMNRFERSLQVPGFGERA